MQRSRNSLAKQFIASFLMFLKGAELDLTSLAVAYYLLISVFPIFMLLANLLPHLQLDVAAILAFLREFFPSTLHETIERLVTNVLTGSSTSLLGISILTTLWSISKSMIALQKAFNKAYGIDVHRDFIVSHVVGIFLGVALQLIVMASLALLAIGKSLLQLLQHWTSLEDSALLRFLQQTQPVVYLALFGALVLLYLFLPNVRIEKAWFAFPGAVFVLVVMETAGKLFGLYLSHYASRLLDFRFVTVVVLLVAMSWFIFIAHVLIIGAVLNATVQRFYVAEFTPRTGDVVSVLRRLQAKFQKEKER